MAVSRPTGHRQQTTFWERVFGQLTRYDLVLTVIPLLFVLALVAYAVLGIPFHAAVTAGAVLSVLVLADALFFNPPINPEV